MWIRRRGPGEGREKSTAMSGYWTLMSRHECQDDNSLSLVHPRVLSSAHQGLLVSRAMCSPWSKFSTQFSFPLFHVGVASVAPGGDTHESRPSSLASCGTSPGLQYNRCRRAVFPCARSMRPTLPGCSSFTLRGKSRHRVFAFLSRLCSPVRPSQHPVPQRAVFVSPGAWDGVRECIVMKHFARALEVRSEPI